MTNIPDKHLDEWTLVELVHVYRAFRRGDTAVSAWLADVVLQELALRLAARTARIDA